MSQDQLPASLSSELVNILHALPYLYRLFASAVDVASRKVVRHEPIPNSNFISINLRTPRRHRGRQVRISTNAANKDVWAELLHGFQNFWWQWKQQASSEMIKTSITVVVTGTHSVPAVSNRHGPPWIHTLSTPLCKCGSDRWRTPEKRAHYNKTVPWASAPITSWTSHTASFIPENYSSNRASQKCTHQKAEHSIIPQVACGALK